MNVIQVFGSEPWVARVGWTLLHFLWQGTAVAAVYMIIRFLFAGALSPRSRYALACIALLAMAVAPPLTYLAISDGVIATERLAAWSLSVSAGSWFPDAVVTIWALGVLGFSARLFRAFRFARKLRTTSHAAPAQWQETLQRVAARMGAGGHSVRLVVSSHVNVPAIIGWLQPIILVPGAALSGLPTEHILALLAHEVAHIRRNDYITSIMQSLAEVVLFYHPAVWWISGQIRAERELCCDDLVIAAGTDVLTYARALTELESRRPLRLRPHLAADGGSLAERIRRLIDPAHISANCLPRAGSACAMILLLVVGTGALAIAGAPKAVPAPGVVSLSYPAVPAARPEKIPSPGPVSTLVDHARNTLLFDPVLTAQLAGPQRPDSTVPAEALDPNADLPMAVEVNFFRLNNAESYTPISLLITGGVLAQARRAGAERTQIEISGEIKDEADTIVQKLSEQKDIGITHATQAELTSRPIEYRTAIKLLPGTYSIRLMAHDSTTNRVGTWSSRFFVPNLGKEDQRVPISSVVLGTQRPIALSTGTNPYMQPPNPLFQNDQELVPSVTRVFSSGSNMSVYLQAFQKGATTTQPLTAYVSFLKDSVPVLETPRITVTEGLDPTSKMVPIRMNVPLGSLKPGEYICQVTVLDPATQKTASWQAPVTLTP